MTEYEQFQQMCQTMGVPHVVLASATRYPGDTTPEGALCRIRIVGTDTTFWFHENGRFLGVINDECQDWQPRKGNA